MVSVSCLDFDWGADFFFLIFPQNKFRARWFHPKIGRMITLILHKLLQRIILTNSLYEAIIILITQLDKTTQERKLKANTISHQNRHKTLRHKLENIIYQYFKRLMHHDQVGFILKIQAWLNILKSVNRVHHIIINGWKLMFISINSKVQH